ncbi:AraC family transcriptional regulator [Rhodospira trueperi]|uniref:AraC-type DNA-binding protein n=1 Tax=Rhodospira trueperi TaxID=69960 RepID=A0A1G7B0W8_9PROT|nr:AraC family transcriptional regulator [Rhodospira trueperi]SDE19896.1 AraC-type DNA-binding protein [Rhodospira trueperi]
MRTVYEPLFCVVAQGGKRVLLGDRVVEYRAGAFVVVSLDLPVSTEIHDAAPDAPYLSVTMTLDRALLTEMLLALPDPAEGPATAPPGMDVSTVTDDLLDPVVRLIRLLDHPADIPVLAPLVEREILYRLLRGEQGAMLRQIALADSHLARIGRAIAWIRGHYTEPLRIDALAATAGMSPSTFHRHFKAATAMSPLQFHKQIRLQEARRLLVAHQGDASRVGFTVGYESASQFSREYSRLFGAPPARDAALLRAAATGDGHRAAMGEGSA